jgi:AcrR family transcriptional regulator
MPRVTREQYFLAALAILGEQGPEALSLSVLCERVGVTKGSFYHHFTSMAELHHGMLEHWVDGVRHTPAAPLPADARGRLTALRRLAVEANHETEVAIRAWAAWFEPAADAVRRVQRRRRDLLAATFEELGIDEAHAQTLAKVGMTLMVGVQSDIDKVDRALLDEVLTEYQRWIEASLQPDR